MHGLNKNQCLEEMTLKDDCPYVQPYVIGIQNYKAEVSGKRIYMRKMFDEDSRVIHRWVEETLFQNGLTICFILEDYLGVIKFCCF